jgi:hypothetical protein
VISDAEGRVDAGRAGRGPDAGCDVNRLGFSGASYDEARKSCRYMFKAAD